MACRFFGATNLGFLGKHGFVSVETLLLTNFIALEVGGRIGRLFGVVDALLIAIYFGGYGWRAMPRLLEIYTCMPCIF